MIRKCLFPVAGYGTRFLPATKAMPKELLPIVNKPLVQYAVEEAVEAGLVDILFVTGRGKRALEDHFDISYELEHQIAGSGKEHYLESVRNLMDGATFSYTRQNEVKGLGDAILVGQSLVGDEAFGVALADDLCLNTPGEGVLAQMTRLYRQFRCSIVAVVEVPREDVGSYGVVVGDAISDQLIRVTDMIEKPDPAQTPSTLAISGRYILTPDIFGILKNTPPGKNNEVQLTDALLSQCSDGCVVAYKYQGRRFDCGSVPGFVAATNFVYQHLYD